MKKSCARSPLLKTKIPYVCARSTGTIAQLVEQRQLKIRVSGFESRWYHNKGRTDCVAFC